MPVESFARSPCRCVRAEHPFSYLFFDTGAICILPAQFILTNNRLLVDFDSRVGCLFEAIFFPCRLTVHRKSAGLFLERWSVSLPLRVSFPRPPGAALLWRLSLISLRYVVSSGEVKRASVTFVFFFP